MYETRDVAKTQFKAQADYYDIVTKKILRIENKYILSGKSIYTNDYFFISHIWTISLLWVSKVTLNRYSYLVAAVPL